MSFTFNGINSDDMGLFVERYPERPFPTRKQSVYDVHGRSGSIIVDENAFKNVTQTYEVYIKGGSAGFQAKASAIANWLLTPTGYANLTDSYNTTVYRKARFTGGVSFLNALNKYGKATISFDCCPQRYPSTPETLSGVFGDSFTVPNVTGIMNGYPLITFTDWYTNWTKGTIQTDSILITLPRTTNHQPGITIETTTLYVDFEKQIVYDGWGYVVDSVTISGEWKPVSSNETIITTDTSGSGFPAPTIEVQTRRWYL